ncbi:MAG: glycosyltransferase family 2 protein, partial [Gammaproteobacteria bacterium]|nr:glycosyltransferase family 2 protein [Gammaproteobacteria bacterium]
GGLWSGDPLERRATLKQLAWRIPMRPLWVFLYNYLWRRGFLDGREGFTFCYMRAVYEATINIKRFDLSRRA